MSTIHCPLCTDKPLAASTITDGLPGFSCKICNGSLISILSYRYWLDHHYLAENKKPLTVTEIPDSRNELKCPKCSRLMAQYQINESTDNKIDLCLHCAEFWLDTGEWTLLKSLNLEACIPSLFSDSWQKNINHHSLHHEAEMQIESSIGNRNFRRLKEISLWLNNHTLSADLWLYLYQLKNSRKSEASDSVKEK